MCGYCDPVPFGIPSKCPPHHRDITLHSDRTSSDHQTPNQVIWIVFFVAWIFPRFGSGPVQDNCIQYIPYVTKGKAMDKGNLGIPFATGQPCEIPAERGFPAGPSLYRTPKISSPLTFDAHETMEEPNERNGQLARGL